MGLAEIGADHCAALYGGRIIGMVQVHQSAALTGRNLGEITERSLMREVCGKPGVARIFRKSFDTNELFGALQKVCGFENNRVND